MMAGLVEVCSGRRERQQMTVIAASESRRARARAVGE